MTFRSKDIKLAIYETIGEKRGYNASKLYLT